MSEEKQLSFYKAPFHKSKYVSWVYDSQENFVFQFVDRFDEKGEFIEGSKELQEKVLESLNTSDHRPVAELNLKVDKDPCNIFNGDQLYIIIRGWGNLTGVGAHNFTYDKAAGIQNAFRDWLLYKLSK